MTFVFEQYFIMSEISHSDISGITTKAPCKVALIGERHVRIEISDFVMRTFVRKGKSLHPVQAFVVIRTFPADRVSV